MARKSTAGNQRVGSAMPPQPGRCDWCGVATVNERFCSKAHQGAAWKSEWATQDEDRRFPNRNAACRNPLQLGRTTVHQSGPGRTGGVESARGRHQGFQGRGAGPIAGMACPSNGRPGRSPEP